MTARATAATMHLAASDRALAAWIAKIGIIEIPRPDYQEPYESLINSVAHQQLHASAATAILRRMFGCCGGAMPAPAALLALPDEQLRGCGFSGSKISALRDIAEKAAAGLVPTRAQARRLSDAQLIERLTSIRGVGQWTVEMLLIFTLNRPDVLPVDDFGVREGFRILRGLEAQPRPGALAEAGKIYAPYRSLAALYFWRAADAAKKDKESSAFLKKSTKKLF